MHIHLHLSYNLKNICWNICCTELKFGKDNVIVTDHSLTPGGGDVMKF